MQCRIQDKEVELARNQVRGDRVALGDGAYMVIDGAAAKALKKKVGGC